MLPDVEIEEFSEAEELKGKLAQSFNQALMKSVLDNDKQKIDEGKVIRDAINMGLSSFTPDMMFEQLVKNYSMASQIYGEKLIKFLSGYEPGYVERNIKIPEFRRELKKRLEEGYEKLGKDGFVDKQGIVTEKGIEIASLSMYIEELDNIVPKGVFGERVHKKSFIYGDKGDVRAFKKYDRYKDIAARKSVNMAVRRGHSEIMPEDLKVFEREAKGKVHIVYAMDSSGSMKGNKIDTAKKAGIALAYKAIENKDKVGLIVFADEIKAEVMPTEDFGLLIKEMAKARSGRETNIKIVIEKAIDMFTEDDVTKHLILLTDALPTAGKDPEKETLQMVSAAANNDITISLVGISLDKKGAEFAKRIIEVGNGRLYMVKDLEELDKVILEDYYEYV